MRRTGSGKDDAMRLDFSKASDSLLMIFAAAKLNLKIIDLPVRYREQTYGSTNISR